MQTFKDNIYRAIRFFNDNIRLAFDLLHYPFNQKDTRNVCHYLIVGKPEYLRLAIYSVSSFLRFHKGWEVVLHFDESLYTRAKFFRFLSLWGPITCTVDQASGTLPLVAKAHLIIQLQGTKEIFVDADTRWNGSLSVPEGPLVLAREFSFSDNHFWSKFLVEMGIDILDGFMINTSLFSWGGINAGISVESFDTWKFLWDSQPWAEFNSFSDKGVDKQRLFEQVFLSLHISKSIYFVAKEEDSISDGGILESTYFGATQHRFGR